MRRLSTLLAATVLSSALGAAQPWAPTPQFQVSMDLAAALRAKDAAAAASLFTPNGVLQPPDAATISGRAEIEAFLKERFTLGSLALALVSTGSTAAESLGVDAGTCDLTVTPAAGEPKKGQGTYLAVLRQVDGKWKIERLAWGVSWSPAARAPGETPAASRP